MPEAKIKAAVFDLGNVLVDFDHTIAAGRIAPFADISAEEIFALFFDSPVTGLFEEGKIPPQEFFAQVKEMLGLRIDYPRFLPIWNEIFFLSQKNRDTYALVALLKNKFPRAMITNINVLHLEYLRANFDVFSIFNHIIASCEVGARKPDPLIYRQALRLLDVDARELFYSDDRPELVKAARGLGIEAFVFTGVEKLKSDLASVGVSIQEKDYVR